MDVKAENIFSKICRLCIKESKYLRPIFIINDESFLNKIIETTSLQLGNDDGLPNSICKECIEKVLFVYEFREQCYQSDVYLRQQLEKEPLLKNTKLQPQLYEMIYDMPMPDSILIDQSQLEADYDNESLKHFLSDEDNFADISKNEIDLPKISEGNRNFTLKYKDENRKETKRKKNIDKTGQKSRTKQKSIREPKQCQICGKICIWLRTHMLIHAVKGYECEYCGKSFTQSSHYKIHLNIHTGNKPYTCELCDKNFADPGSKRSHMVTHTKERKYKCDICDKSFGYSHTLSAHKRTHTQDRKHVCSICSRPFLSKYGLTKHFRTHTGEKPYKCEFCEKRFTTSGNIQTHRRIHTRERPYKCELCPMTFAYKGVLNGHIKVHERQQIYVNLV